MTKKCSGTLTLFLFFLTPWPNSSTYHRHTLPFVIAAQPPNPTDDSISTRLRDPYPEFGTPLTLVNNQTNWTMTRWVGLWVTCRDSYAKKATLTTVTVSSISIANKVMWMTRTECKCEGKWVSTKVHQRRLATSIHYWSLLLDQIGVCCTIVNLVYHRIRLKSIYK